MTRHLAWLLLALSVLFNLFFVAGYLQARGGATVEPPEGEPVARALDLDNRQAEALTGCRASLDEEAPVYQSSLALVGEELRAELARDEPDLDRLAELAEREAEIRKQWHLAAAERLFAFAASLRPEQREHLERMIGGSPRHAARMQRMLDRFDADRDGRLDEAETEAAVRFVGEMRQEAAQRRQRMLRRFDVDGDGELSDEERAALQREFRRRRGERGSGGPRRR